MSDGGNAKIREQHLLSPTQQHILRLDIAVDEFLLVGVLQASATCLTDETITGSGTRLPLG